MRRTVVVGSLVIACLLAAGCLRQDQPSPSLADSLYCLRCGASGWWTTAEGIALHVPLVLAPTLERPLSIGQARLGGAAGSIAVERWSVLGDILPPEAGDDHDLLTLVLRPQLTEGDYLFTTLELTLADGSTGTWDIGTWRLSVVRPDADPVPAEVGKHTLSASDLEYYFLELSNTGASPLAVLGLRLDLPGVTAATIAEPDSGGEATPNLVLAPGETRCFEFWFDRTAPVNPDPVEAFTLKPLLLLDVDGLECTLILPQAAYLPAIKSAEQLRFILNTGGRR